MVRFDIFKKDALLALSEMADASVDLIVTDIPYESLEKHRKIGTTTRLKKDWFDIFPNDLIPQLFSEMYRVLKKNSHLYFFCDSDTMFFAKPIGESAGFKFWKPIVWDKVCMGMGYHYRAQCEFILFFEKGKLKMNTNSSCDVASFKRPWRKYPTEKPVDLGAYLINESSKPGQVVLDPFCGSGAFAEASLDLGRSFIGMDTSQKSIDTCRNRLVNYKGRFHE